MVEGLVVFVLNINLRDSLLEQFVFILGDNLDLIGFEFNGLDLKASLSKLLLLNLIL